MKYEIAKGAVPIEVSVDVRNTDKRIFLFTFFIELLFFIFVACGACLFIGASFALNKNQLILKNPK
jgi:hypothetical protein